MRIKSIASFAVLLAGVTALACQPADEGTTMDETAGEMADEAGDTMEEAAEEAGEAMDEAADEVGEAADSAAAEMDESADDAMNTEE